MRDYLVGPVRAALRTWDRVLGLVVGSYHNPKASTTGQHSSEAVHTLALEAVEARAHTQWRLMGAKSEQREAPPLGVSCTSCGAAGAASSGGRGRASSAPTCLPSDGRTPRPSGTARHPLSRVVKGPPPGRWGGVAAGGPRRGARGAWAEPGVRGAGRAG